MRSGHSAFGHLGRMPVRQRANRRVSSLRLFGVQRHRSNMDLFSHSRSSVLDLIVSVGKHLSWPVHSGSALLEHVSIEIEMKMHSRRMNWSTPPLHPLHPVPVCFVTPIYAPQGSGKCLPCQRFLLRMVAKSASRTTCKPLDTIFLLAFIGESNFLGWCRISSIHSKTTLALEPLSLTAPEKHFLRASLRRGLPPQKSHEEKPFEQMSVSLIHLPSSPLHECWQSRLCS